MEYQDLKAARRGEHNDCAVVMTSLVTGVSYHETLALFTKYGRKPKHGTPFNITKWVLWGLGIKLANITKHIASPTVATIEHELYQITQKVGPRVFVVITSGHILCFKDGKIQDWTKDRQHRVLRVFVAKEKSESDVAPLKPNCLASGFNSELDALLKD
jgi:hypothetical protein